MKNEQELNWFASDPSDEEIQETIKKVKEKYDVVISEDDAVKYYKLYNQLKQWFLIEKNAKSPEGITKEIGQEIKSYIKETRGDEIASDDANGIAKRSLELVIPQEKDRLANEIRALIAKYK